MIKISEYYWIKYNLDKSKIRWKINILIGNYLVLPDMQLILSNEMEYDFEIWV